MRFQYIYQKTRRWISDLTVGGSWGRTQSALIQHNLRWFWLDGFFASASDNIVVNFVSLYILSLGATQAQIGLMSSLSNLTAAALLLPGAFLAERIGRRKEISLFCGGGFGRLALLMLVFVPILMKGAGLVWIAIALSVTRDAFSNLGYPSWMGVTNDIVPMEGRGRYFGARNFVMGIAGMAATLIAGQLITLFVAERGYQIALGIAFVLGAASTFSYAKIHDKPIPYQRVNANNSSLRYFISLLKGQPQFVALAATAAVWNFALNVSGPFFNVFMVQDLKFNASEVGILAVVSSLTGLLVQNRMGELVDRLGPRKVQFISMSIIPLIPLAWIPATQVWHIALINIFSGAVWGAFNLASFNLLLASMPKSLVPRYSAIYQIIVTLSLSAGALVGSLMVDHWGFVSVLIASAIFRWVAAGLFARWIKDPTPAEPSE